MGLPKRGVNNYDISLLADGLVQSMAEWYVRAKFEDNQSTVATTSEYRPL